LDTTPTPPRRSRVLRLEIYRDIFLSEMEQVLPWSALLAVIPPYYTELGNRGRQSYPMETMLRVHLMQQWYALSDPAMEEAL